MLSSPICLLSKASKTKSWLWHQHLSHLNFGTINQLAKQGLVRGLPKLKFEKYHLCSSCSLSKSKKYSHKAKSEDTNQQKLYLLHMDLCGPILARTPQQNDVVERRNQTLIEAARTMLIFSKAPLFLWAKAVATAYYTHNRSLICLRHYKTSYEILHDRKPYLTYFHVFGALCYPTNDSEDLGKLKPKADIAMASEPFGLGPEPQLMTPETISSGLVQKPPFPTPYVPPTKNDREILFPPLFDEYFNPPPSIASQVPAIVAPEPTDPKSLPSSTSIDQDAPSPSTSQTPQKSQSTVIPSGVEEQFHDIEVAHLDNDPFFGVLIPEPNSEESSSRDIIPTNVHSINQPLEHHRKLTKYHPLDNVIGNPSRPVSTRHQLQTEAMFCYFDAFLTSVKIKNYKEALKESCWIEAI
ncbi:retrovirus-related pol polyprotein from transposon TNT 1-94 [Tanacetum coccineum]